MTRTRRALRLSPLAFALALGAYCENPVLSGRISTASPPAQELVSLEADPGETDPVRRGETATGRGTPQA